MRLIFLSNFVSLSSIVLWCVYTYFIMKYSSRGVASSSHLRGFLHTYFCTICICTVVNELIASSCTWIVHALWMNIIVLKPQLLRVCKSRPSQSSHAYTALMTANQPEIAVHRLPGLLCTHLKRHCGPGHLITSHYSWL